MQQVHDGGLRSTGALYQRRVPVRQSITSGRLQKMARAIFSQVTVLAAFSGGSVSRASNQQTPSGWGAKFGQLQIIRYDRLLTSLLPFLLATTLFSLFWTSGSAGTSREVHCAITRATSSWTSSSYFRLHQQPWCQGALLWLRVARFPSGFVRRRFLRVCPWFHFSQKARESLALSRLRNLDCPKVGRTCQAAETGSRCSHLHQVGEEFLNSEVASEVSAVLPARRVGGTGGIRGRKQRTSSARLLRGRSLPPWTTETPLASVPRGDGNVVRGCVGADFSDGVSDHRSGLKATHFPSLPCFPFRCPFKRVVRRLSTPRCVQEWGAESIPPIVPVRGYVELVRKFVQGDY